MLCRGCVVVAESHTVQIEERCSTEQDVDGVGPADDDDSNNGQNGGSGMSAAVVDEEVISLSDEEVREGELLEMDALLGMNEDDMAGQASVELNEAPCVATLHGSDDAEPKPAEAVPEPAPAEPLAEPEPAEPVAEPEPAEPADVAIQDDATVCYEDLSSQVLPASPCDKASCQTACSDMPEPPVKQHVFVEILDSPCKSDEAKLPDSHKELVEVQEKLRKLKQLQCDRIARPGERSIRNTFFLFQHTLRWG